MKNTFLFPAKWKKFGYLLFLSGLALGIHYLIFNFSPDLLNFSIPLWNDIEKILEFQPNNLYDELLSLLIISGGLITGFSKEKIEDEMIQRIRLNSLVWAVLVNYLILIALIVLLYDFLFFDVMTIHLFSLLILFVIKYKWEISKMSKTPTDEE